MSNIAHKRRRWAAWRRHMARCIKFGTTAPTKGMNRYLNEVYAHELRRCDRQFARRVSELTGIPTAELYRMRDETALPLKDTAT